MESQYGSYNTELASPAIELAARWTKSPVAAFEYESQLWKFKAANHR